MGSCTLLPVVCLSDGYLHAVDTNTGQEHKVLATTIHRQTMEKYKSALLGMVYTFEYREPSTYHLVPDWDAYERKIEAATVQLESLKLLE